MCNIKSAELFIGLAEAATALRCRNYRRMDISSSFVFLVFSDTPCARDATQSGRERKDPAVALASTQDFVCETKFSSQLPRDRGRSIKDARCRREPWLCS